MDVIEDVMRLCVFSFGNVVCSFRYGLWERSRPCQIFLNSSDPLLYGNRVLSVELAI